MKSYNEFAASVLERREQYNAEKKRKRKKIFKVVLAIVCLVAVAFTFNKVVAPEKEDASVTLAAEIEYNLVKLSELDSQTALSSNPYDYKDEESYDNIVEMGPIAMVILHEKYLSGEIGGLNAYIAGSAIEDIARVRIKDISGVDWASAEEFFAAWQSILSELPNSFKKIVESEEQVSDKIEAIKAYGVFGDYFLDSIKNNEKKIFTFYDEEINVGIIREYISEKNSLSEDEYAIISEYLEEIKDL